MVEREQEKDGDFHQMDLTPEGQLSPEELDRLIGRFTD